MNSSNDPGYQHYTLAQHLRSCSEVPEYRLLSASADIVREEVTQMLDSLCKNYGYYSKHDISHSDHIISTIELILGEDRIRRLSPTDAWMLIISAYWHDVGMYFSPDLIQQEWEKTEFKEFLKSIQRNAARYYEPVVSGYSLFDAASLFVNENNRIKTPEEINESIRNWDFSTEKSSNIPMISRYTRVEQYIIMLFDEYIRRQHPDLAKKEMEKRLYTKLEMMGIQRRLWLMCGKAAAAHGKNIECVLKDFPRVTNGVSSDYAHPRFAAVLLCLGDLLDADNNRFNIHMIRAAGGLPAESRAHYGKHFCLTHILANPERIELSYDLGPFVRQERENDTVIENNINSFVEVFQIVSHWNQMIEETAEFFRRSWFEIVPDDFPGSAPTVERKDVYLGENRPPIVVNEVLNNYEINYHRAFGVFSTQIYGHRTTFIRELVQNSMDATKQVLHKDAINLLEQLSGKGFDELAKQPRTLCREYAAVILMLLYENNYAVKTSVSIRDDGGSHNKTLRFLISDVGIGIDREAEIRMQHVGISSTDERNTLIHKVPAWIRPTGAFGIGMHSAFSATDEIWISSVFQDRDFVIGSTNLVLTSQKKGSQIVHIPNQLAALGRKKLGTDICLDVSVKGNRGLFQNEDKEISDSRLYELLRLDFQDLLAESIIPFQAVFHSAADHSARFREPLSDNSDREIKLFIKKSNRQEGKNDYGLLTPFVKSFLTYIESEKGETPYTRLPEQKREQYWVQALTKSAFRDSYIVRDQGHFYVLNLNQNDILDDRRKNILLCIRFARATYYRKEALDEGEVSFKGAWIDQRKQYYGYHKHLALPRLSYALHILGRPAQSTVPASREYLLADAAYELQDEMNQALDDLIEYIAVNLSMSADNAMLDTEEEKLNYILYAFKYLWGKKGLQQNNDALIHRAIEKLSSGSMQPWTKKYTVADDTITFYDAALPMKDPLTLWYMHETGRGGQLSQNYRAVKKGTPAEQTEIFDDPWVEIEPDIAADKMRCLVLEDRTLFYIHYRSGTSARLTVDEETVREYLKMWAGNNDLSDYIPAFFEFENLAIPADRVPAQNHLGLFSAYVKMPTFLPEGRHERKNHIGAILNYLKKEKRCSEDGVDADACVLEFGKFVYGLCGDLLDQPDSLNGNVYVQIMQRYLKLFEYLYKAFD